MPNLLLLPAHLIRTRTGSVSGPVDATYLADWLCDGSSARGILGTSGSGTYTCNFAASGTVNFAALIDSNVTVNAVVSGGFSGTLVGNPEEPDGTVLNPYVYGATTGSVSSVTVAISGNPASPLDIGEFVCGHAWELEYHPEPGATRDYWANSVPREDDVDFLPDYDLNGYGRTFDGNVVLTDIGLAEMIAMWKSQRGRSRACVIVPTPAINDAWWGRLTGFGFSKITAEPRYRVRIQFREFAQSRRI